MNKRSRWAWHGRIWQAPVADLAIPLSWDRLFPQCVLPARGDKTAHVPPAAMLRTTAKEIKIVKNLCRMPDAVPMMSQ